MGIEGVEGDIDAAHAAIAQLRRIFGELAAVGRQGQLVEGPLAAQPAEAADEMHDVAADERLAAGQAQLPHAEANEGRADALQLLEAQDLRLRQEGHVLRHAIDAAEIAAVGDRHPQIGDPALIGVDQRRIGGRHYLHRLNSLVLVLDHISKKQACSALFI